MIKIKIKFVSPPKHVEAIKDSALDIHLLHTAAVRTKIYEMWYFKTVNWQTVMWLALNCRLISHNSVTTINPHQDRTHWVLSQPTSYYHMHHRHCKIKSLMYTICDLVKLDVMLCNMRIPFNISPGCLKVVVIWLLPIEYEVYLQIKGCIMLTKETLCTSIMHDHL